MLRVEFEKLHIDLGSRFDCDAYQHARCFYRPLVRVTESGSEFRNYYCGLCLSRYTQDLARKVLGNLSGGADTL